MIWQSMERNDVKRILEEMRFNSPISSVYFLTDNQLYDPAVHSLGTLKKRK